MRSLFLLKVVILIFVVCGVSPTYLGAQDSTNVDQAPSVTILEKADTKKPFLKNYFKEDYPSPKKAITLAIIPGMGQIYNKKYWKLPLVYGALGGVIYLIDYNTARYNIFKLSHEAKTDATLDDPLPQIPPAAVKARRDGFDKNRQLSWIGLIGFYLISAGDAFVDAHLKDFNVDDNISIVPAIQTEQYQPSTIGLSLRVQLSK